MNFFPQGYPIYDLLRDGIIEQIEFMKEKAPPGDLIEDQSEILFSLSIYIEDYGEEVTLSSDNTRSRISNTDNLLVSPDNEEHERDLRDGDPL